MAVLGRFIWSRVDDTKNFPDDVTELDLQQMALNIHTSSSQIYALANKMPLAA